MLGAGGVGKTSIRQIFTEEKKKIEQNYRATIGADFSIKDYVFKQQDEKIHIRYMIYDLAGQSRYKSGRANFIEGSHACILVYDIANRSSLEEISEWLNEFKEIIPFNVPIVLVANKIDLRDNNTDGSIISTDEGVKFAQKLSKKDNGEKKNNLYFIEVSALENINIDKVFDYISEQIYDMYLKNGVL